MSTKLPKKLSTEAHRPLTPGYPPTLLDYKQDRQGKEGLVPDWRLIFPSREIVHGLCLGDQRGKVALPFGP